MADGCRGTQAPVVSQEVVHPKYSGKMEVLKPVGQHEDHKDQEMQSGEHILDFSQAVTGSLFFVPTVGMLDEFAG